MGLRRAKFRGAEFVREQILMTAAEQNIKRMVKMLSRRWPQKEAMEVKTPLISSLINGLLELFCRLTQNINRMQFDRLNCF